MSTKLSGAQVAEVLSDAANTLRAQQAYIHEMENKLAAKETRDRAEKIASEMHRKGLELDQSVEALADRLEKAAADDLAVTERAVAMVGPDMGQKIGSAAHMNELVGAVEGNSDLERYLTGQVG
jgi:hypothetical protein